MHSPEDVSEIPDQMEKTCRVVNGGESETEIMDTQESVQPSTDIAVQDLLLAKKKLEEEIQYYKRLLEKKQFEYKGKTFVLQSEKSTRKMETDCVVDISDDDLRAESVSEQFIQCFDAIENELPRKLGIDRCEVWKIMCKIFQTSFRCCRDEVIDILVKPLYSLTELSQKENDANLTCFSRKDDLVNVSTAYSYLLSHSLPRLKSINQSVIDKVTDSIATDIDQTILSQIIVEAVKICWKMQILHNGTPMFLCQPKLLNEKLWHKIHRKSFDQELKEYELVYYRPVLMFGVGGTVAHKGFVGNRATNTDKDIFQLTKTEFEPANKLQASKDHRADDECNQKVAEPTLLVSEMVIVLRHPSKDGHNGIILNYAASCAYCKIRIASGENIKNVGDYKYIHQKCEQFYV